MTDAATVVMAISAALGALLARPAPLVVGAAVAAAGLLLRRAPLLWIAILVIASALAARSWSGLSPPAPADVDGTVTLASDPADVAGAVVGDVIWHGRHLEAWAHGAAGRSFRARLAGERVVLTGRLQPLPADARPRAAVRHVAGRLAVKHIAGWQPGPLPTRLANRFRRLLEGGASSLPLPQRALFAGFVLGDNREEPPGTVDDFRASGLSHLLAVSGENVAFALAVVAPLLRRLGLRTRLLAGLIVLGGFGVLTRWQPSVLRAEMMAALALLAFTIGRPVSGLRILALAVTALLLIDPLLVHSVGFGLSVGASAGITLLAVRLARRIPGPRPLATAVAVTASAQVGVAPILAPVFGGIPLVTLPANLLAMPAAGPVTIWGLAMGPVAGLLGGRAAALIHAPTRLMLAWVAAVATALARAPFGSLSLLGVVLVSSAALLAVAARRPPVRLLAAGAAVIALLWPALMTVGRSPPPVAGQEVARGARLWRAGVATVLVLDRGPPSPVLAALRQQRVTRISVLVLTQRGSRAADDAAPVIERFRPAQVVAPGPEMAAGETVRTGRLLVTVTAVDDARLSAEVQGGDV